jgi:hypothetical protein
MKFSKAVDTHAAGKIFFAINSTNDRFFIPKEDTMKSFDLIIAEYGTADFERRLDIFMQYRHLRDVLVEIDQKSETKPRETVADTGSKKPSAWRRILSYAHFV